MVDTLDRNLQICLHQEIHVCVLYIFSSTQCNILCMKSLLKILQTHQLYKDVFREVGMLEVMVTCLHRYAALQKSPEDDGGIQIVIEEKS